MSRPLEAPDSEDLRFYSSTMDRLYRSIAIEWKATHVVDSSKLLPDALALGRFSSLESRFIHTIRDGRGVTMSRVKRRARLDGSGTMKLPRLLAVREARRWTRQNIDMQRRLGSLDANTLELRYEQFTGDIGTSLDQIERFAGARPGNKSFFRDGHVMLSQNHTTSGNRNRWRSGEIAVEEDLTWQEALGRIDRHLLQLAARRGLRRFGYR